MLKVDPLVSGFGPQQLKVFLDVVTENLPTEGFSVCELGVGGGAFTGQVLGELNSNSFSELLRYVATDALDVSDELAQAIPSKKVSFQVRGALQPPPMQDLQF